MHLPADVTGPPMMFDGMFRSFHRTNYVTLGALGPLGSRPLRKTVAGRGRCYGRMWE